MNKKTLLIIGIAAVGVIFGYSAYSYFYAQKDVVPMPVVNTPVSKESDPKNGAYSIGGQLIELKNGSNDESIPNSEEVISTRYFGNEISVDMNGDGAVDTAFILTQTTGGTGTFYYVAALLSANGGFVGTNAVLLGDRIAPQTTGYGNGQIIVNFSDRAAGEPMTARPSVGVSKYIKIDGFTLTDVTPAALTEAEARLIAEQSCIKGGEALSSGTFNENSKTWWFDANLNATRPGCNPACVVDSATKTAELNWRCTGLLPPVTYNLDKTFVDKKLGITYQYTDPLPTNFYRLQDWKQTAGITLTPGELACDRIDKAQKISLFDKDYCVTSEAEGAAGSIYTTYTYATAFDGKVATLKFVVSHPTSCLVYESTKNLTLCENESFVPSSFAVQILSTLKLSK